MITKPHHFAIILILSPVRYLVPDYGAISFNILGNTVRTRICELNCTPIPYDLKKAHKLRTYQIENTTNRKLEGLVLDV